MEKQPVRRSSLFLLELMISILFFSLASALCMLLFAKANSLERRSADLNHAVNACTSVAEILKTEDDVLSSLSEIYPDSSMDKNIFFVYYDKDWIPCTSENAEFILQLMLSKSGNLLSGDIQISKKEAIIYSLTVKKHLTMEEL